MVNDSRDQPAGGRFEGSEHRFPVRVHFEDTDLSGVVYHANYLRFMERARSDMLRVAGIDQRAAMEAGEGAYAVARMNIRYLQPARLDDALLVASKLLKVQAAYCVVHQSVRRGEVILADAEVVAAWVAPEGGPKRQPAAWVARFKELMVGESPT